jgi:hypothetical protein
VLGEELWGIEVLGVVIHVQKVGIDFDEVFAPEARVDSIEVIVCTSCLRVGWFTIWI